MLSASSLKLYSDLSTWWPVMSPHSDYEEEATFMARCLLEAGALQGSEMLELGSGGGNNAFYLRNYFRLTLSDLSPGMLEMSRRLHPDLEHHLGDMKTLRLGRTFDVVFVHDAIMYLLTEDQLRAALLTARIHLKPGGLALLAPDFVKETFEAETDHGGHDVGDRSLRYLEWVEDPDPTDTWYNTHYSYVLKEGDQIHFEGETHREGLFPRQKWLDLCREVGFDVTTIPDPWNRELLLLRLK